jgi:hypothetical protein
MNQNFGIYFYPDSGLQNLFATWTIPPLKLPPFQPNIATQTQFHPPGGRRSRYRLREWERCEERKRKERGSGRGRWVVDKEEVQKRLVRARLVWIREAPEDLDKKWKENLNFICSVESSLVHNYTFLDLTY